MSAHSVWRWGSICSEYHVRETHGCYVVAQCERQRRTPALSDRRIYACQIANQ